jgi:PST family polysaccharide transporter
VSYLVPIITIPYIIRIIGPEKFGLISIAQAASYYLMIIVDFGYSITGVQKISQTQNSNVKQSEAIKNIFFIQIFLCALVFLPLVILLINVPYLNQNWDVFFFAFISVPANILIALWFYTGVEKVRYINYITVFSKAVYLVLIVIFIREISDYKYVPLIYSTSLAIAGIYSIILLYKKFNIRFGNQIKLNTKQYLKSDWNIFVSNLFINLYRNSNILILGLFASETSVGIYSAAEKLVKAIQGVFTPITQVLYPFISRRKVKDSLQSISILKKLILVLTIITSLFAILIIIFADQITILILGEKYNSASILIKLISFVITFSVLNYMIGIIFMTNYNMKKEFSKSVMIVGILNVVFCSFLSYEFAEFGAAISFIIAEFLLLLIMLIYIYFNKSRWQSDYAKS